MIKLEDVSISFRKEFQPNLFKVEKNTILDGISIQIEKGECFGILGESGSGKTTMGKAMCGLLKPNSGDVFINDLSIYKSKEGKKLLKNSISIVFQDYSTSTNPRFTIKDVISEGLMVRERKLNKKQDRSKKISELLELVGLNDSFKDRFPHELSGGQLQRVCIARALACNSEIILFEEGVSSLDAHTQVQIMDLLLELKEKYNLTYIFITHDLSCITYFCDRVMFLKEGKISQIVEVDKINTVEDEYAKKLLNSIIDFEIAE